MKGCWDSGLASFLKGLKRSRTFVVLLYSHSKWEQESFWQVWHAFLVTSLHCLHLTISSDIYKVVHCIRGFSCRLSGVVPDI